MPIYEILEESQELPGSGLPRTPGMHLTDVINAIEVEMGWRKNTWEDEPLHTAGEIGFIWEDILSFTYASRMTFRPGEVTCDGIICSPDGLGLDPEYPDIVVLEEYKCTWKSAKHELIGNWRYMTQIASYLHALDLDTCIMRVLYLNGIYNGQGPIRRTARIKFDEFELRDNWKMISNMAKEIRDNG